MAYFELSDQERRSFLGADPHFVSIDGPVSLVRFVNSERAKKGMSGRYWMYGNEVAEIIQVTDRERNWMKGPYFPQQMSRRHLGAVG